MLLSLSQARSTLFSTGVWEWGLQRVNVWATTWLDRSRQNQQHVTWRWQILQTITMFCLWNLCLVFSVALPLSHDVVALAAEVDEDVQPGSDKFGPDTVDLRSLPLSRPLSSAEQLDSQGVIGEYDGLPESTEATVSSHGNGELVSSQPTSSSNEEATGDGRPTQEQYVLSYESTDLKSGSFSVSVRTSKNQSASPAPHFEMDYHSHQFPLSGSPEQSPEQTTPVVAPGQLGWTTEPLPNSQRQDILGQTTDTSETFKTGAVSKLEDTGEGLTTLNGQIVSKKNRVLWIVYNSYLKINSLKLIPICIVNIAQLFTQTWWIKHFMQKWQNRMTHFPFDKQHT